MCRDVPDKNGGPRIWRRFRVSGALSLTVLADKLMLPLMAWYELHHNSLNALIGFPGTETFTRIPLLILRMARSLVQRSVSYVLALSVTD